MRDVAGMLRSFHYVSHAALTTQTPNILLGHEDRPAHEWATFWYSWSAAAFLREYLRVAGEGGFLPPEPAQARLLLEVFLIEKTLYELRYEMNHRPDWMKIPLEGLLQLVAGGESARDPDPSPPAALP